MITKYNIISFDFGTKIIGIAIAQWITYTINPITIYKIKNKKNKYKNIKYILNFWKPKIAIIGIPINNKNIYIIKLIKNFANKIKQKYKICVILNNENYSTKSAKEILFKYKGYYSLKKKNINKQSAIIILESWLKKFLNNIL